MAMAKGPLDWRQVPSLWLPFGVIGAATGWLSAGIAASPALGWREEPLEGRTAIVGGAMAMLIGFMARNFAGSKSGWAATTALVIVVSSMVAGWTHGTAIAGAWGAAVGLLSVPLYLVTQAAAARAGRARMGSIVAAADRRGIALIAGALVGAATLGSSLAAAAARIDGSAPPLSPIVIAGGATALAVLLLGLDLRALRALDRLREAPGELRDVSGDRARGDEDDGVPEVDLGLGQRMFARVAPGAVAYRDRERVVERVAGSVLLARRALVRAVGRDLLALGVGLSVLGVHHLARGPRGEAALANVIEAIGQGEDQNLWLRSFRCRQGDGAECRRWAHLLLREEIPGRDVEPFTAALALSRGCALGDGESCVEVPTAALLHDMKGCMAVDAAACDRVVPLVSLSWGTESGAYFARRAAALTNAAPPR